ncbi:MAG: glycosyltransferase family 2 protein [Candidatus Azobacteroides sp.]|nr:glycosyltransferase family 2 protein [Candidatus Azobacteroides sp.]
MKLSIVIVNYNVKYFLEQCLLSVIRASINIESEIFVVDNCSDDFSFSYLVPRFPQVNFIGNSENVGFSKANNHAIQRCKGEYILLLNPDTVVGEHVFEHVCQFMDEHEDAGGVGVKMINGEGLFLPESKRGFPTPWTSFCKIFGISSLFPMSKLFGKYHLRYLCENQIHEIDVMAGAFMMLRKKTLDKCGLLDETFFMYGEDIDLSYRITLSDYKNYYLPEIIIHYKGESTKKDDAKYVKIFYHAMLIFFQKHYPNSSKFYTIIIYSAIVFKASLAIFKRLVKNIFKIKSKKDDPTGVLIIAGDETSDKIENLFINNHPVQSVIKENLTISSSDFLKKIENKIISDIIFSNEMSFEEIINFMNLSTHKKRFRIFCRESECIISSNDIIHPIIPKE